MDKEYSEEELAEQLEGIQKNAETALKLLADTFVENEFGYDEVALEKMESLVNYLFHLEPKSAERTKLEVRTLAACFLGECIIRACGGKWIYYDGEWAVHHDEKNIAFPFSKVQKFCDNGETDSFVTMYKALKYFHDNGIVRDDGEMNFKTAKDADDIGKIFKSEYFDKPETEKAIKSVSLREVDESKVDGDYVDLNDEEDGENNSDSDNHCHGYHWDAVLGSIEEKYEELISISIQESKMGAKVRTKCVLDEEVAEERDCCILKYNSGENFDNPITVKLLIATNEKDKNNLLMSAYPCATKANSVELKILEIDEWENEIEATITAELPSEKVVTFFDTDYALHKDEYEIGRKYVFDLAGIAYTAQILEQGEADFEFTGQQAIDFKRKTGEEPEYDENGEVIPVHFSLDKLVAFLQHSIPDDAEFHSPLLGKPIESEFFGVKTISGLSIVLDRDDDENETTLPVIVAAENLKGTITKDNLVRGVLWVHGCLSNGKWIQ